MERSLDLHVLEAIADTKGIDPAKLDPPLQEYIDTDALQLLASHDTASWELSFELPSHNVTVTSDGVIRIDGAQQETWS